MTFDPTGHAGGSAARSGWVYLVGAGPGDPSLITARGLRLLRSCDSVLYDRLVSLELLDEAPAEAERISVGKQTGPGAPAQAEIDRLVVERARAGRAVVRLKGGDPYVLGRGADEAQALGAAGIPFEVVPGVTSATAVPAAAGIPVTYGGVASSFAVLTAHRGAERFQRWGEIARGVDTIVLLMGTTSLRDTTKRLIEEGRDPAEPAALVHWGTTPSQRTVVDTLSGLADAVEAVGLGSPSVVVVGEVVRLRDALNWFERRPLFGQRVVVTRAKHQAAALGDALAERGAQVIYLPVIRIAPPEDWEPFDRAVKKTVEGLYEWIAFASVNAVDAFFERLDFLGFDTRSLGRVKVAAVGRVSAEILRARGVRPDVVPDTYTGDELARAIGHGPGRVLLPRPENAPPDLPDRLKKTGWIPEEVIAYRNLLGERNTPAAKAVAAGAFDAITFTSGSTVRNFVELIGPPAEQGLSTADPPDRLVVCIGPQTARAAEKLDLRVDVVAKDHTGEGLVRAFLEALAPLKA